MAMATKSPAPQSTGVKRMWKTRNSKAVWFWLGFSLLLYGGIYAWYIYALKSQQYPGPLNDPLRLFGIVSYALVLIVTAYTLRRRFARWLPGNVQGWLWLHIWLGIASVLIAMLHDNYFNILHYYNFSIATFTYAAGGMAALYLLIVIVVSGIIGRLLDSWQAHTIKAEANRNGVGISRSVKERLDKLELHIERLSVGKSPAFKHYCEQSLKGHKTEKPDSSIPPLEMPDLYKAGETLSTYHDLNVSWHRQRRAEKIIVAWRYIHIPLSCLAVIVISYHSLSEIYKMIVR